MDDATLAAEWKIDVPPRTSLPHKLSHFTLHDTEMFYFQIFDYARGEAGTGRMIKSVGVG